jgi:HD-GYP domain-containing protein (c-di-GMP phosphodiesterase class II)
MLNYIDYRDSLESEGDIVAEDIKLPDGKKLMSKGTILNEYHINRLIKFNIRKIWIIREIRESYSSDEEVKNDILDSTVSIMNGILQDGSIKTEHRDRLFKILYYSNPENFAAIVNYVEYLGNQEYFVYDHSLTVAWLAVKIGSAVGVGKDGLVELMQAGLLHDVGKYSIPGDILNKVERLSDQECELIRRHPLVGYHMIKDTVSTEVAEAVLYHHEKLNGAGYPFGVTDADIPRYAKIISIADTFEALISSRPYRHKFSPFMALRIMRDMAMAQEISYGIYDTFQINFMNSLIGKPHPEIEGSFVVGYDKEKIELIYMQAPQ